MLDDEINVLHAMKRSLRQLFSSEELRVELFSDPEKALIRSGEVPFDAVVSDYRMPAMNGIDFLKAFKGIQPDAVRLILSASTEFDIAMKAINQAEIFRYVVKPWQPEYLKITFGLAFARRDQILEDRRLADELRSKRGELTPQEIEAKRLEDEEPGITKVNWGPDGSVNLE